MCNTPNTDPFGNVIRSCYCEAEDIAAAQSAELATIRAENYLLRSIIQRAQAQVPSSVWTWHEDAKEALK